MVVSNSSFFFGGYMHGNMSDSYQLLPFLQPFDIHWCPFGGLARLIGFG